MSKNSTPRATLDVDEVTRLIDENFPAIHAAGRQMIVESVADRRARVRLAIDPSNLRPGGTVSGPAMFTLADFTIYVALLGTLGPTAIPAVTSNLSINFLLRPDPVDAVAEANLIRIGKRLAYAEVALYSVGREDMIAHATGSYALAAAKT